MNRSRALFRAYICILAVWMQLLAPTAMAQMASVDPFHVICSQTGSQSPQDHPAPGDLQHHACCVACHAPAGIAPLDTDAAYLPSTYPASARLDRDSSVPFARAGPPREDNRPRGPPYSV